MRHSRFIAYTLLVTLMASVIAGAMSVSLHFAKAQYDIQGYSIEQLLDLIEENYNTTVNASVYQSVYDRISALNVNASGLICVAINGTSFACTYWEEAIITGISNGPYAVDGFWYYTTNNGRSHYTWNLRPIFTICGGFGDQTNRLRLRYDQYASNTSIDVRNLSLDDSVFNLYTSTAFPSTSNLNNASWNLYFSKDIYSSNDVNILSYEANLFEEPPAPEEVEFEVKSFWLGERQYITVVDQYLMYSMIDYNNEGQVLKSFRGEFYTENSSVSLYLPYEDTVLIEGGESFIDGLTNVSAAGVYAWDITNLGYTVLHEMFMYYHVDGGSGDIYAGYCINCPYNLITDEPGTNGQPTMYTEMWSTFNEYVNNYHDTHFIPDDLSSWLFGISGSNIYPASVSVPLEVWNNNRSVDDPASFANIHTWKWWMMESNININFELMDVVIVSESSTGNYSLIYYYDDRLSTPWKPVENVSFDELVELFDVIIVVPDNDNCLIGNSWWQNALSVILTVLRWDNTISLLNSLAVSGTSSLGVEYVDERPDENAHVLDAFCIVTKKCLDKQKMLIFSDYLPKLYKLMSDYVESEDNWKADFLKWSSSMFYGFNTIDGTLNKILSSIEGLRFDLNSKLDQLIQNTSEEEPNHWFPSLWLWVLQFKPSNNDFSVALDVYDDNWDNFPLLPAPSTIPALPTIQGG